MTSREKLRKAAGIFLVALILALCATPQFRAFVTFPEHVRLPLGQVQNLALGVPLGSSVGADSAGGLQVDGPGGGFGERLITGAPLSIAALQMGQYQIDFKLFGLIPVRRMTVDVVEPIQVIPGGHSIGVQLRSHGVLVVGHAAIRDESGALHQPAREAGIQVGDAIVAIDGTEVTGEEHAADLFDQAGKGGRPVSVTIRRDGKVIERTVTPVRDRESGRYRVGLYIRDGASGVGTLTFYHPESGKYGALGHVISEGDGTRALDFVSGQVDGADVVRIERGRRGVPGEKITNTLSPEVELGSVERNTRFGIFGRLHRPPTNPLYPKPIPVAMASQVEEGPAEILTVVSGRKIERFQVEIVRLMREPTAEGKNMIIRVTDPRLLEETGGIVQGMSGSPIIQNGRVVGAVTHVFVNDPTRGYGVLIEWMLQEAGILKSNKNERSPREGRTSPGASGNDRVTAEMV